MIRLSLQTTAIFFIALLLFSCEGKNRNAKEYLSEAKEAYLNANYSLAKLKIDSIRILFPKSFDEINAGIALMQEVRMAENRRNIIFCDSMLRDKYTQLNVHLSRFDYVRDVRYQEFGEYYPKAFPHHISIQNNGIRAGVSEKGVLFLESILSGTVIHHNRVRVSSKDGNFAESLSVTSEGLNYTFKTLDNTYEIVRYSGNSENGVAGFVYAFKDQPLSVQFIGKRNVTVALTQAAKTAIIQSYELSSLLLDIEQLKLEKEKSEALIRYLESKKQ